MRGKAIVMWAARGCNTGLRRLTVATHRFQHYIDRGIEPKPEWYDHTLDIYWQWPTRLEPLYVERGIVSLLAIDPGARVLDLCCGDGYSAKHFYSHRASELVPVDFDPAAIKHARAANAAPNIRYEQLDVRESLPDGPFDNVVWDAAIEHFTEEEIRHVVERVAGVLRRHGTLSGYTVIAKEGGKHLREHEREFADSDDLASFLMPFFTNVTVFSVAYQS